MSKVQYEATVSMFAYCTEILQLSESEAYLRIAVARAARKLTILLEMLRDGRLHLSGIEKLASHLTEANRDKLLKRATHQSKRQVEKLIAEIAPKPDVAPAIRRLPPPRRAAAASSPSQASTAGAALQLGPDPVTVSAQTPAPTRVDPAEATPPHPAAKPALIEPLGPRRYKVQFTASAELRDKLDRLKALMRGSIPDGDLATIIDATVTEKLERLEARRFGKTKTPRKNVEQTDTTPRSRHIPAAVRRAVYERDGGRCAFVDKKGRRCTARQGLEFDHRRAYGRGGDHRVENLELACVTHNQYRAELEYGRDAMQRYRDGVKEGRHIYEVVRPNSVRRMRRDKPAWCSEGGIRALKV
jgi:hypothetical protein